MKKSIVVVVIIASFILGAFVGGYTLSTFSSMFALRPVYTSAAARANITLAILDRLRNNKVKDTVELLETSPDGDIITFKGYVQLPTSKKDKNIIRIIQRANDYRSQYPRATEHQDIDNAVKEVFAAVKNQ